MFNLSKEKARETVIEALVNKKYRIGNNEYLSCGGYYNPFGVACEEFIINEPNINITKTYIDDIEDGEIVTAYNKLIMTLPCCVQEWLGIRRANCSFILNNLYYYPMVCISDMTRYIDKLYTNNFIDLFKDGAGDFYE